MHVEIDNAPVNERQITTRTGDKMVIRSQQAFFVTAPNRGVPFTISISANEEPYAPGRYAFTLDSFNVEDGRLVIARYPRLVAEVAQGSVKQ